MHYVLVCPIGVIGGKEDLLTYHADSHLPVGSLVKIPFGSRQKQGVVIQPTSKPTFTTKPVTQILTDTLPGQLMELAQWISEYYGVRLATVLQTVVPQGVHKKRRLKEYGTKAYTRPFDDHPLSLDQQTALQAIRASQHVTHILRGVTGSGKTRVYQELARDTLTQNKSALILVPEIALTPQLATEFQHLHPHVMVLHSGQTEAERHTKWRQLRDSNHPWIVVGPRSSLFSPITDIGLIVIDECHEPSYQQDSQPKYSALRVARKLAELHPGSKLILGSATPSVTDYYFAREKKVPIIRLDQPTVTRKTDITVVDIRERASFGTHALFSKTLLAAMNTALNQNQQVLLFHNRRATARTSLCGHCGWVAECMQCHIPMRLHHDHGQLWCHVCGRKDSLPQTCPTCSSPDIDFKGFGSKRVEAEVRKLFPNVTVARFDSDTPTKEQLHHRYQDIYDSKVKIIIGTQGVAKGLDLPNLTTVGVIQADSELFIPDFSSNERAFQLLTQVIGRAGRTGQKSHVVIQTLNPDHPAIAHALRQDYEAFFKYEIKERAAEHVTPFTHMLHLVTGYASATAAEAACQKMAEAIRADQATMTVRGPAPAFHEHRGSVYYWQLTVLSSKRSELIKIVKNLPARWQFTLDPINLL